MCRTRFGEICQLDFDGRFGPSQLGALKLEQRFSEETLEGGAFAYSRSCSRYCWVPLKTR